MNLTQFQRVYANANAPSGARIASALLLFVFALGELLVGLLYVALVVFGAVALVAALGWNYDMVSALPERWRGAILAAIILAVFTERLGKWSVVAQVKAAAERARIEGLKQ